MAAEKKTKTCKGPCHKTKPVGEFPNSPHSKDGKLGFCSICWSEKMSKARKRRFKTRKGKARIGRPPGSKTKTWSKTSIDKANDALKAANAKKEQFLVRANDGDQAEFTSEEKALRQAMEWQMAGYAVTVWRQCQFEMVLRIIG
jgi:hypothetical protein